MRDRGRLYGWLGFVAALSALGYASRFSSGTPRRDVLYLWSNAVLGLVVYAVMLGIVLLIVRERPKDDYLALERPRSWRSAAGTGVLVLVGVYAVAAALSPLLDPGNEQGLVPKHWQPDRAAPFVANFVVVALVAPIVEELVFRGLGYRLLEPFGRWAAILGTALAFGLVHGLVEGLPILFAFGAGLAYLRSRTGSVYPGMLVHGTFNALVLIVAVST